MINPKNRTKHLLCNALITLLIDQKRSFESVTINEICEQAIIHRTTFYTHFTDKYALFQYLYRSITEKRMNYTLTERIYEPFRISTELKQVQALRLAINLTLKSNNMKTFIEPLIFEAIAQDIKKYRILRTSKYLNNCSLHIYVQLCSPLINIGCSRKII